ncbi:MAG: alpha-L-fucosidase [Bacteroidota bacterium]|nr:alpha-L-fucosidase [Bacteroidota bacterium]
MIKKILTAFMLLMFIKAKAQQHNYSDKYVVPDDPLVQQKLAHWQDIKFGLMMHWGTYSEWGIVESWSICPEDEGWTQRRGAYAANYFDYVKAYENLQTTFNPTKFDPDKWATAAKEAGMKYVVFTTKHHDGFCMFDTKQTDYKVTSPKTPFSKNPKANIAKEIFNSFRKDGFMIGAYFSKPDWHCPYYWWPYFPPKDRNVNYDPEKYPDRWNDFKNYTYNQIQELMTGYGRIDILWLDGGWVRPKSTIDTRVDWQRGITYDQDIDMPRIAKMARSHQPGLLVVDRTVSGKYENYVTPEQTIPSKPLPHPWESCITMGNSWSYVPHDHYKPTNQLVHMLLKIISRGGNFLLNIGPSAEGDWSDTAYQRLKEIGVWMKVHADGVYNTIPMAPYEDGNIVYLQSKDKKDKYIYLLSDTTNEIVLPSSITVNQIVVNKKSKIVLLDAPKERIKWKTSGNGIIIQIPSKLKNKSAGNYAVAFKILE